MGTSTTNDVHRRTLRKIDDAGVPTRLVPTVTESGVPKEGTHGFRMNKRSFFSNDYRSRLIRRLIESELSLAAAVRRPASAATARLDSHQLVGAEVGARLDLPFGQA